jgi:DNA-directed RNA polymerase II subunit RPB2
MAEEPPFIADDLVCMPLAEASVRGLISDHIRSGDDFVERGISQIMTNTFKIELNMRNDRDLTEEDKKIETIDVRVVMKNVRLNKPVTVNFASSKEEPLMPSRALLEDKTYGSALRVDIDIYATAHMRDAGGTLERHATLESVLVAEVLPIMVRGTLCHTRDLSPETLLRLEEDPSDAGGCFIVGGVENLINNIESSCYNMPRIFRNLGHKNEVTYLELLSKPGDHYENSSQLLIKLLTNDQLVCIIDHPPFEETPLPFFILFRMLGWVSDRTIMEWILNGGAATEVNAHINKKLKLAYDQPYEFGKDCARIYDINAIMSLLISQIPRYATMKLDDEATAKWVHVDILKSFDMWFLPHIGSTPAHRHEKAQYLTHLIRSLFLVEQEIVRSTDRDAYSAKRAHAAGVCYAKAFKQQFNFVVVQPIKKSLRKAFKDYQFSRVDLAKVVGESIAPSEFTRALEQAITTGRKTQITVKSGGKFVNRLTSQQVHRKNQTNTILSFRQVSAPNTSSSKQSQRAEEMRQVHPEQTGYLDCVQTQDSESVGLNKQLSASAWITVGGSSLLLCGELLKDNTLIQLDRLRPEMLADMAKVKVNGHWIGCVPQLHVFAAKWRKERRAGRIDPYTSIVPDFIRNICWFWVDTGRLMRPLFIVYNSWDPAPHEEKKEGPEFTQWITMTSTHIRDLKAGKITNEDLMKEGIIEYISPEEQTTLLLAIDHDVLWANRHNPLLQYTHCDVPSTSLVGFGTLLNPYGTHAPNNRIVLAVNQFKQSCGWFAMNWPFRIDKEAFHQYNVEMPLAKTIVSDFIRPNGLNVHVGIDIFGGYNQEDSVTINEGFVERGGFDGVHFTLESTVLEKAETLATPDPTSTDGIKQFAIFEHLIDGLPPKGTILRYNYVAIGKKLKLNKPEGQFTHLDRSVIYKLHEDARVLNVVQARNQEGKPIVKVQLMIVRRVVVGDKFAMRSGQKGVCGSLIADADAPFDEDGVRLDFIFNPFGHPSRMTQNMQVEIGSSTVSAAKGMHDDATLFHKIDLARIRRELRELGLHDTGKRVMYCGTNGKRIDAEIYSGPVFYQRLQKFVDDTIYAAQRGPSDPMTRQPLGGKAAGGSTKLGEMEKDVAFACGASRFIHAKFYDDSSGTRLYYCRECGNPAIVNHEVPLYRCRQCGDRAEIVAVESSWTANLALHEMSAQGIGTRMNFRPFTYERRA